MATYYTVTSPSPADLAASSSYVEGADLEGAEYALCKINDGEPIPVWDGTAVQIPADDVPAASQSAVYRTQAGDGYRELSRKFGEELLAGFVAGTGALTVPKLDELLDHLSLSLDAAKEGYITTLRYQLAKTPTLPPGFTAAVRGYLVGQCDQWLAKYPGRGGQPTPAAPDLYQLKRLDADDVLVAGCGYVIEGGTTFVLPSPADMGPRTTPMVVANASGGSISLTSATDILDVSTGTTSTSLSVGSAQSRVLRSSEDSGGNPIFVATL